MADAQVTAFFELMRAHPLYTAAAAFAALLLLPVLSALVSMWKLRHIPTVGLPLGPRIIAYPRAAMRFMTDCRSLVREGYRKYPDSAFKLWTPDGFVVVLPASCSAEVGSAPLDVTDKDVMHNDRLQTVHTKVFPNLPIVAKTSAVDLSRSIARKLADSIEETRYVLDTEIGSCKDWKRLTLHPILIRLVSQVSNRSFIGFPKNRDPRWRDGLVKFTIDLFTGAVKLKLLPGPFRRLASFVLPEVRRYQKFRAFAMDFLEPTIKERLESKELGDDFVGWLLEAAQNDREREVEYITLAMLQVGLAAIHTTGMTLVQAIADLAHRPEYLAPLREEIETVLAEDGGVLTKAGLQKLKLVESFLKESMRLNPALNIISDRMVVAKEGFTLSNGVHLPCGTWIGFPASAITVDEKLWDKPNEFDGFRFAKLRDGSPKLEPQYLLSNTSTCSGYPFGTGKYACPGRWFAAAQLMYFFAELIRRYDFDLEGRHPQSLAKHHAELVFVDPTLIVRIRDRQ